jgi:hypothetical protein
MYCCSPALQPDLCWTQHLACWPWVLFHAVVLGQQLLPVLGQLLWAMQMLSAFVCYLCRATVPSIIGAATMTCVQLCLSPRPSAHQTGLLRSTLVTLLMSSLWMHGALRLSSRFLASMHPGCSCMVSIEPSRASTAQQPFARALGPACAGVCCCTCDFA